MTRPVLVVSHDASRTGAPRVAIDVLYALRASRLATRIILRWGGPLEPEFRAGADAIALEPLRRVRVVLRRFRRSRWAANRVEELAAGLVLLRTRPAVVYLNSAKSGSYVRMAVRLRIPVIFHLHEVEPVLSDVLRRWSLSRLDDRVVVVACSDAVRAATALATGRDAAEILVVQSAIDVGRVRGLAAESVQRSGGVLTIGTCATGNTRKGVDLWLEVIARVRRQLPSTPVRFVWVGKTELPGLAARVEELDLAKVVEFTGEMANPYPHLAAMDVVIHPARADPFPLAVLEAMALGRPIVAFNIDGVATQLAGAGALIPPFDVTQMAAAVVDLIGDRNSREDLGRRAEQRARKFDVEGFRSEVRRITLGLMDVSAES